MTTLKLNPLNNWIAKPAISTQKNNIYNRWVAFTNSQAKTKTQWYLISMMVQGVLFLPIPAVLIYYYHAPIIVLAVTMTLFFTNIIAGMGGSKIGTLMSLFALSILIHLCMLGIFIL
jgi:hypothetical protein